MPLDGSSYPLLQWNGLEGRKAPVSPRHGQIPDPGWMRNVRASGVGRARGVVWIRPQRMEDLAVLPTRLTQTHRKIDTDARAVQKKKRVDCHQ